MFSRAYFFAALGLACCLLIGVQCHPMVLLDRADEIKKTIKGTEYTLKPLSANEQGENSKAYKLVGGWKGKADQPAIVKIVDAGTTQSISDNAEKEKKFLDKKGVKQLYHYEKEKTDAKGTEHIFVLKDIHTHYPTADSPNLAPLYEILDENSKLDVEESVTKVRQLAIKKAEDLAESDKFVYRDIQPLNVWANKELTVVYFIDYGVPGVVDVSSNLFTSSEAKKKKEAAIATMKLNAKNNYTVSKVKEKMGKTGTAQASGSQARKRKVGGKEGRQSKANA